MSDRASWSAYAIKEGLIRDDPDPAPAGNKYHAIAVHVDGRRFASKKEAARYLELRLLVALLEPRASASDSGNWFVTSIHSSK